ncbi:unnamed protein product [Urochloa decumbens]|uniref:J domain-containing protein n=1 Tax=Urochloa decumbens TaxID=240449 RepID=A0ABC9BID8_9POAL
MITAPLRVTAPKAPAPIGTSPFRSASASPKPSRIRCAAAAAAPPAPAAGASTLYEVLGLRAGATVREIKAAYRRLARERHPDVAGAAPGEFVRLHDAYATLSDPDSRARYDRGAVVAVAVARRSPPTRWAASAGRGSSRPRRTWETDQCW